MKVIKSPHGCGLFTMSLSNSTLKRGKKTFPENVLQVGTYKHHSALKEIGDSALNMHTQKYYFNKEMAQEWQVNALFGKISTPYLWVIVAPTNN